MENLRIKLDEEIKINEVNFLLPVTGTVNGDSVEGFFITRYENGNGKSIFLFFDPFIDVSATVIYTKINGKRFTFGASRNPEDYDRGTDLPALVITLDSGYLRNPEIISGEDIRPDLIDFLISLDYLLKKEEPVNYIVTNRITLLDNTKIEIL